MVTPRGLRGPGVGETLLGETAMALAEGGCVGAGHFRAIQETLGACAPEPHAY
jgi:hypothetical protein